MLEDQTVPGVSIRDDCIMSATWVSLECRCESLKRVPPSRILRDPDPPLRALHPTQPRLHNISDSKAENLCVLRVREQRNLGDTVIATHEPLSSSLPEMRLHNIKRRLSRRAQLLNLRLGKIREAMRRPIGSELPFRLGTQVSAPGLGTTPFR